MEEIKKRKYNEVQDDNDEITNEQVGIEEDFKKDDNLHYINIDPYNEPFECLICHREKKVNEVTDEEYIFVCIPCIHQHIPNFKQDLYSRSWLSLFGPEPAPYFEDGEPADCQICEQITKKGFNIPICKYHQLELLGYCM